MKKLVVVLLLLCFAFTLVSCSTVKINCKGGYAFLAPDNNGQPKAKTTRSKMVFYVLYGLIPITDNSTGDMIKPKEIVRVKTTMTVLDYLITMIGSFVTITTHTVEVEVIK